MAQGPRHLRDSFASTGVRFTEQTLSAAQKAQVQENVGVVPGENVQEYAAELDKVGVQGTAVASATTINLETATGEVIDVTGTTNIEAVTLSEGHVRIVRFTGILTLVRDASLILQSPDYIVTVAGDYAIFIGGAAGVVRCLYFRADGGAVNGLFINGSNAALPETDPGVLGQLWDDAGTVKVSHPA